MTSCRKICEYKNLIMCGISADKMQEKIFLYKVVRGDKLVPGNNSLPHQQAQEIAARLNHEARKKGEIPENECIYFVMGD